MRSDFSSCCSRNVSSSFVASSHKIILPSLSPENSREPATVNAQIRLSCSSKVLLHSPVRIVQSRMRPSEDELSNCCPWLMNLTARTEAVWPSKVCKQVKSTTDQSFTVLSLEEEAKHLSTFEKQTFQTPLLWPFRFASGVSSAVVHNRMHLSWDADATIASFGAIATQLMSLSWALTLCDAEHLIRFPLLFLNTFCKLHRFKILSEPPLITTAFLAV